ncbi:hypothetical protein [Almyronema epifaneia]|uniref:Uncharacterized protein n=1 Tax=Almyronema epifaneia S1 TaxID=2991925 RepID=A0ABW6IK12_9CYAN
MPIFNPDYNIVIPQANTPGNKGDLYVHDGSGIVPLPGGDEGNVLTRNPAAPLGVEWAEGGGGGGSSGGGSGGGSSGYYGFAERLTGEWMEISQGVWKPLYSIRKILGPLPNDSTLEVSLGLPSVEKLAFNLLVWASNATTTLSIPYAFGSSSNFVRYLYDHPSAKLTITTGINRTDYTGYCLARYAKMDDPSLPSPP